MEGDWSLGDCGVDSTTELEVETLTGPTTLARCAQLRAMGHEAHSKVIKADIFGKGKARTCQTRVNIMWHTRQTMDEGVWAQCNNGATMRDDCAFGLVALC